MAKDFTPDDDALLAELGVDIEAKTVPARTPREERVIAGFEEIQRFVAEHGHPPQHGEGNDIFERLYAVRLDRIRALPECRALLDPLDTSGLLTGAGAAPSAHPEPLDDDALLAQLGVEGETPPVAALKHVRSTAQKKAADEVASRGKCEDFATFKPLFERVQQELEGGVRITRQIRKDAGFLKTDVKPGDFFILNGQTAFVASVGKPIKAPNGEFDARLRVIFSNGTQSNLLLRSLQRALYKDETSRRISDPGAAGPLFDGSTTDGDETSGTIYVLRSKSDLPVVRTHRTVLHKIGVTSGRVERRIANAKIDATFLLADVEVVATYQLYNINRAKLENLIHRVFEPARLEIAIKDRFGRTVVPREWFLVPLNIVDEAVERIKDTSIKSYAYDPQQACLVEIRAQ